MKALKHHHGLVAVLNRSNVDTDAIIPKQFLKSIRRTGYGDFVFDEWRYLDQGQPGMDCSTRPVNPDFELNQERYQGASILIAGANFGCGSSREHAVWGLHEYGFRVILAPSFADIFHQNCSKNGVLAIVLDTKALEKLRIEVEQTPGYELEVDLMNQTLKQPSGETLSFSIEPSIKHRIAQGLDDIAVTLTHADRIKAFEIQHHRKFPWLKERMTLESIERGRDA